MGVTGLWKLIEPCGHPVPVETLESKILAVDISIWLHQAVKGFQDNKGSALANAHLLGLFHRLCKLLYFRVKPVFVFDGSVPQLKLETIARRQQQRNKLTNEADRIQALLLQSLAKEKVVQQALGANAAELLLKSPTNRNLKKSREKDGIDDIFKLPEIPEPKSLSENKNDAEEESDYNDSSFDCSSEYSTATEDSSFDESNPQHYYNANLQNIDVRSKHFRNLPADVRHDILVDIKETRKQSSWGRLHELPSKSDDFSTFQMKRLLKRRAVQQGIEEAEQEMGGRSLTYSELSSLLTEEGIVEPTTLQQGTKAISSDENTRFLLVRDLKKKLTTLEEEEEEAKKSNGDDPQPDSEMPSTSQGAVVKHETTSNKDESLGTDYEHDLELAIALSLEDSNVYSSKDYDYNSDDSLKLNKDQRKLLKNAAVGPARAYMIEYGGMNEDEVVGIMEQTQKDDTEWESTNFDISSTIDTTYEANITEDQTIIEKEIQKKKNTQKDQETKSDTDSDLEEVTLATIQEANKTEETSVNKSVSDLEKVPSNGEDQIVEDRTVTKTETEKKSKHIEKNSIQSDTDSDLEEVPLTKNHEAKIRVDKKLIEEEIERKQKPLEIQSDMSDTDSDLEEVPLEDCRPMVIKTDCEELNQSSKKSLEVIVDTSKTLTSQDDLFADVFEDDKNVNIIKQSNSSPSNVDAVLLELQKQAQDITKIKLDDIKIDSSIIVLSDDDGFNSPKKTIKNDPEIVEILDDSTMENNCLSKSPAFHTPSKKSSILEYFERDYVVKRTTETPKTESDETIPKVKSPFYVNKTPKSGKKRSSTKSNETSSSSPARKISKATKTLFQPTEDEASDKIESNKTLEKAYLNEASNILKEQKTSDELNKMALDIAKEKRDLESERNRQERMGMSISQRMNSECQELLRLFGIPYIVAPMEAEAQCAFLDAMGLTHGTITDDSDIWLFGGRTVYKNFFAQNKHVLEFRADEIQKLFNCDRLKMIQLACLVGSDYTTGIHGIGTVTALEILATFSSKLDEVPSSSQSASVSTITSTLRRFRDWWITTKTTATPPGSSTRLALHKKLKNIELHEGFPNTAVIDAYLTPTVDDNKETFSWGYPDVESIREFAKKNFGWTISKTDDLLMPVMKKLGEKKSQATITNYFNVKSSVTNRQLKVSKRVQNAIDKMSGKIDEAETPEKTVTKRAPPKKRKVNTKKSADNTKVSTDDSKASDDVPNNSHKSLEVEEMVVETPNTNDVIPQRQKRLDQMRKNKEKAVQVLKQSLKTRSNKK